MKTAKYINALILVIVASGTALVAMIGDVSRGSEPLQTVFFAFVAAIIAIQVVPALMLLGYLVKGLLTRPARESEQ
ncbi:MAG: hypothetical protein FDZ69_01710 [Deltaproteobacteria bacterium]|nr:MAG: hypothetical protein FDZ69_01710 [Deltaproteobacteria bacterium]